MSTPVYLDYNATTPVDPEVSDAIEPYLREHYGNPSSSHAYGRRTHDAIEQARAQVAGRTVNRCGSGACRLRLDQCLGQTAGTPVITARSTAVNPVCQQESPLAHGAQGAVKLDNFNWQTHSRVLYQLPFRARARIRQG